MLQGDEGDTLCCPICRHRSHSSGNWDHGAQRRVRSFPQKRYFGCKFPRPPFKSIYDLADCIVHDFETIRPPQKDNIMIADYFLILTNNPNISHSEKSSLKQFSSVFISSSSPDPQERRVYLISAFFLISFRSLPLRLASRSRTDCPWTFISVLVHFQGRRVPLFEVISYVFVTENIKK